LKGTYAVTDGANEYHYGSTCVKRNLGISGKEVNGQIVQHKITQKLKAQTAYEATPEAIALEDARTAQEWEYADEYYYAVIRPAQQAADAVKREIFKQFGL
jgi:hypothetical protein